jgi:serralysin
MPPINDNFANAIVLNGFPLTVFGNNVGATGQAGEPDHAGFSDPLQSVWYSWTAPTSGEFAITTVGTPLTVITDPIFGTIALGLDTTLGVYTGSSVSNLTEIASNDEFLANSEFNLSSSVSGVTFTATAGTTYQIAVDSSTIASTFPGNVFLLDEGDFALNIARVTRGTAGANILNGSSNSDYIEGLGGNDIINGNGGFDALFGGGGNDQISGGSQSDAIDGGSGNDTIYGNGGNDFILGGNGRDLIFGGSGNDGIDGGAGNDTIYGNGGIDALLGGSGNDLIYGSADSEAALVGGDGNDTIYGNGGDDFIDGGAGSDTIWLGAGAATVLLETGVGFDTINNFQLGQTTFRLLDGLTYDDLTFSTSRNGARISFGDDLLAVVSNVSASVFANDPSIFV